MANSKTINIYFGGKHSDTLDRMDNLCDKLRMSRTSLIDYLVTFYEQHGVKDVPKQLVVNGNKYILIWLMGLSVISVVVTTLCKTHVRGICNMFVWLPCYNVRPHCRDTKLLTFKRPL